MFRRLTLFFLFSATAATLLLPTTCHVNFTTSSMLLGQNHSKILNRVGDVFMGCDDRKNCSSSVDSNSADGSRILNDVTYASASSNVTRVCNAQRCVTTATSHTSASPVSSPNLKTPSSPPLSSPSRSPPPLLSILLPPSSAPVPVPDHRYKINSHQNARIIIIIIIGSASGAMGIFIICLIIGCRKRISSTRKENFQITNEQDIEVFLKDHGTLAQKKYKFSEVKKMTKNFTVKLGEGGFGVVYKGELRNGYQVAVKLLKASKGNGKDFMNEVGSISRTSHVNVVQLLGFCLEGKKKALIYEFMPNGSLDKFIGNKGVESTPSLNWDNMLQIAKGIARGLEYLHKGCNTRILHFDIKPHNILLDDNFCPKISDFGLAKLCPGKESTISVSNARGTIGYVAPEVCNKHLGGVSQKSDVYSYGMMLLEILGVKNNVNGEATETSEYFPDWIYRKLEQDQDLRTDIVTEEKEKERRMITVSLWCIQTFPKDRPTMSRVIEMLEGNMNSQEIPPKPVLSSPTIRLVPELTTSSLQSE